MTPCCICVVVEDLDDIMLQYMSDVAEEFHDYLLKKRGMLIFFAAKP